MASAKELKSGSWFIRVYDKETKQQVCFTSKLKGKAGKTEAELMAREYLLGKRQKREKGKTVGECIDEYIDLKENILSPTAASARTWSSFRRDLYKYLFLLLIHYTFLTIFFPNNPWGFQSTRSITTK